MQKIQKTISLDQKTAIIAGRMNNFSGWVRHKLLTHALNEAKESAHIAPEIGRIHGDSLDKCNPKHRDGRCTVCWGPQ